MGGAHHEAAFRVVVAVEVVQSRRHLVAGNGIRHIPANPDEQARRGHRQQEGHLAFGGHHKREPHLPDTACGRQQADRLLMRGVER